MAGSGELVKLLIACLLVMILVVANVEAAISCGTVLSSVSPCLGYLQRGGAVAPSCCDGVRSLNNAANTTPDRQAACRCIKTLVPSIGANQGFVNALPGKCGVNISYNYSPSLDCSKVN